MDKLVKSRRPFRTKFTRIASDINSALAEEPSNKDTLQALSQMLEDSFVNMQSWDLQVSVMLVEMNATDEDQDKEFQTVADYEMKYRVLKISINKVLYPPVSLEENPRPPASEHSCTSINIGRKQLVKLPKIQLRKFNGELTDWLGFWAQFSKIHDDEGIAVADKFQYLVQSMVPGCRAQEVVCSYPQSVENYAMAVSALKQRYGKKQLLVEVYVRELLKLVICNATRSGKPSVSKMFDKLETQLRALDSLGVTSDTNASMLYPLVESSLPEETLRAWQRSSLSTRDGDKEDPPRSRLSFLMEFLRSEVESEERIALAKGGFGLEALTDHVETETGSNQKVPTAAGLHAGEIKGTRCLFCEGTHPSALCGKAKSMTLEDRRTKVKESRACFSCLKVGHGAAHCKSRPHCLGCSRKHYELMCPDLKGTTGKQDSPQRNDKRQDSASSKGERVPAEAKTTTTNLVCTQEVLLCTQLVQVENEGKKRVIRALFDTGAQRSYIQSSAVEALKLKHCGHEVLAQQLFGGSTSEPKSHRKLRFRLVGLNGSMSIEVEALDQPKLCGKIPRLPRGPWMQEMATKGIKVDGQGSGPPEVELLIGADQMGRLLTGRVEQLTCGLTAWQTVFGWTVMGRLNAADDGSTAMVVTTLLVREANIPDLWKLEAIGIQDPVEVQTQVEREKAVHQQFEESVRINPEGRYEVALPWIPGHKRLASNFEVAKRRLEGTTKKLKSLQLLARYQEVLDEWIKEGIIEEVLSTDDQESVGHYLPHRPVVKPESKTTPVRPVFDASCKSPGSPCLNDCLEKGPNLIELLPAVLLRFRENRIGLIADIRKAFLMISIRKEDREFLRFLWWANEALGLVKVYRFCRVVFGVNCSPFLLAAVLQHFLKGVPEDNKPCAEKLLRCMYVDNCVASVTTPEEMEAFKSESTQLLAQVKLDLRLWEDSFNPSSLPAQEPTPVLGLRWDKVKDTLSCSAEVEVPDTITMRTILSSAQRVFDPMGFLSPALLLPKLLLQESWVLKVGWDAELPEKIRDKFLRWVEELGVLSSVKIPRWMTGGQALRETWSLHIFCDASGSAYAAAVYLRCTTGQGVSVQLLQARARVAPLKKATIPRLELLACTLGSRLANTVRIALDLVDIPAWYWSDSTTAITWIQRDGNWGVFVSNRVKEILQLTKSSEWRHVPGTDNPADLPSRGCSPQHLLESRWWEGPGWLRHEANEWPKDDHVADEDIIATELRKSAIVLLQVQKKLPWYMERFSTYSRIVRLMAWVSRWTTKISGNQRSSNDKELEVQEIRKAEIVLVGLVQKEVFNGEKNLPDLRVTKDEEGIIRVKSQLTRRSDSHDFRYPMLLPSRHPLVDSLIREVHLRNCHAGVQVVMTQLRKKFWVIQSRKTIRAVLGKCQRCRRYDGKAMMTEPAPLPVDRVKDTACFEVVGIDLAGPLYVKDGGKVWIVLFTCAVYRAVHLELVSTMRTEGFLQSLRRFIARRGRPSVIYTDNGTNFSGTDNAFRALDWHRIKLEHGVDQIHWKFSPPTAAWWGGWWERLIAMVKKLLVRVLGKAVLMYEELNTVLCDVEATVNMRPLTYLAEDPEDLTPLTPAMFLRGIPGGEVPDIDKIERSGFERRYRYRQRLMQDLRGRFREEYLGMLVQRRQEKKIQPIRVGDVVLIGSDNKKRLDWPMARVLELHPGKDGHVRVVRLKTAGGELLRPVRRLYQLEADPDDMPQLNTALGDKSAEKQEADPDELPQSNTALGAKSAEKQEAGPEKVVTRSGRELKGPQRFGYESFV